MDVELLIAKVYERQPVWNKWNKQHAKRNVVDKMWAEISHELKCEETLARKKWKYLRDQFAVELGKIPPGRSGDVAGDAPTSKWQYFELLLFLKDVVKARASTGNLSGVLTSHAVVTSLPKSPQVRYQMATVEPTLGTEEGASSSHTKDIHERKDEVREKQWFTSPATRRKKKGASKRSKTDDYNHSILDIEQQRIKYLKEKINHKEDKEDDEDQMFFKSLLPHVKRIPAVQKLTFRSRLQELVQQFAYPVPEISPLPDTHDSSSSASAYTAQVSP
ncbi:uncharacterized protein LOC123511495 [Portunus trituberculatus]|uniref:uncharacterized protein LOC123511495 n=1 Tax=Portunus trituberculatus TaxID=210409 RepID=UPI001E1CF09F|nr:uncharacterized protein LOC123511495 [Portunus trituberculatus]